MSPSVIGNSARHRRISPADGIALPTRIGTAFERAGVESADGAHAGARGGEVGHVANDMAQTGEPIANIAPDAALDLEHAGLVGMWEERPGKAPRDDPRGFDRGLRVHSEVDDVADDLDHRLALGVFTGAPEGHEGRS